MHKEFWTEAQMRHASYRELAAHAAQCRDFAEKSVGGDDLAAADFWAEAYAAEKLLEERWREADWPEPGEEY